MEKMSMASRADLSGISCIGIGTFSIQSFTDHTKESYILTFGDGVNLPSCTCCDWEKTRYPCKHFFAVARKFPAWSFDSMSPIYRESVFLNLDHEIIPIQGKYSHQESEVADIDVNADDQSLLIEPQLPQESKITSVNIDLKAQIFREELKRIHNLTFLAGGDVYDQTMPLLKEILSIFNASVPEESGLKLESNLQNRKPAIKRKLQEPINPSLPLRKKLNMHNKT